MSTAKERPAATDYLTTREAAALLRLHPEVLSRMRRQGRGPRAIVIGRSVRFARADLDAWMARHAQGAAA
jgi:excisionase family DNA binding protein